MVAEELLLSVRGPAPLEFCRSSLLFTLLFTLPPVFVVVCFRSESCVGVFLTCCKRDNPAGPALRAAD